MWRERERERDTRFTSNWTTFESMRIRGIPIYNFRGSAGSQEAQEWVVTMGKDCTTQQLAWICKMEAQDCLYHGNPSEGGFPFLVIMQSPYSLSKFFASVTCSVRYAEKNIMIKSTEKHLLQKNPFPEYVLSKQKNPSSSKTNKSSGYAPDGKSFKGVTCGGSHKGTSLLLHFAGSDQDETTADCASCPRAGHLQTLGDVKAWTQPITDLSSCNGKCRPQNGKCVNSSHPGHDNWSLRRIGATKKQAVNGQVVDGSGVNVYVIDTGVYIDHQEFGGRAEATLYVTEKESHENRRGLLTKEMKTIECKPHDGDCVMDNGGPKEGGHGTHCAATIGGKTVGVAPGVTIKAIDVLNQWDAGPNGTPEPGVGSKGSVVAAVDWLLRQIQEPAIVVASLINPKDGSVMELSEWEAFEKLADKVVVVTGAGNQGQDACAFSPAGLPNTITVGSVDVNDNLSEWSNVGKCVDLFAPGEVITSAAITAKDAYKILQGTSQAAPHVAGVAALEMHKYYLTEGRWPTTSHLKTLVMSQTDSGKVKGLKDTTSPNLILNIKH